MNDPFLPTPPIEDQSPIFLYGITGLAPSSAIILAMRDMAQRSAKVLSEKYACPVDIRIAEWDNEDELRQIAAAHRRPYYRRRIGFGHSHGAARAIEIAAGKWFSDDPLPDDVDATTDCAVTLDLVPVGWLVKLPWYPLLPPAWRPKVARPDYAIRICQVVGSFGTFIRDADVTMRSDAGHAHIPTDEDVQSFAVHWMSAA